MMVSAMLIRRSIQSTPHQQRLLQDSSRRRKTPTASSKIDVFKGVRYGRMKWNRNARCIRLEGIFFETCRFRGKRGKPIRAPLFGSFDH